MGTFEGLFERLYEIYHMKDYDAALVEIQKIQSIIFNAYSDSTISYSEYDALFSLGYVTYERIKNFVRGNKL